jgi:hypothetical protein
MERKLLLLQMDTNRWANGEAWIPRLHDTELLVEIRKMKRSSPGFYQRIGAKGGHGNKGCIPWNKGKTYHIKKNY